MSDEIAIKVENLSKVYKLYNSPVDRLKESLHPLRKTYHHDFYALNDISFVIKMGESVGIIGKNGSGKSTLLKILTGVLTPTSGSVTVKGKVSALLELGAGFNPELSGLENVFFNGILMGYTLEEMEAKLDDILAFADIGEFVQQPVKTYSSGMFVRLAFAVAVNVEPEILIVDEALAVGDLRFQKKCKERMNGLFERGVSLVIVSHNMTDIKTMCRHGLYLKNGQQLYYGGVNEAINHYITDESNNEIIEAGRKLSNNYSSDKGGTGDIEIISVNCFEKGQTLKSHEISYGKNIIIEVKYIALNEIAFPNIRLTFSSGLNKYFSSVDSIESGYNSDVLFGEGKLVFEIIEPNLYPNAYFINVGVTTKKINSHLFYWNEACNFVVLPPRGTSMTSPTALMQMKAVVHEESNRC